MIKYYPDTLYNVLKKVRIVLLIITCLVFIVGVSLSAEAGKARKHNPDDITISIVKTDREETTRDYIVYMTFRITNQTTGTIKSISFQPHFSKKTGSNMGYMTCESGSVQIEPGKSTEITFSLSQEKRYEPSDLFVELYNNGTQNLQATFSIYSVKWTDDYSYWEPSKKTGY